MVASQWVDKPGFANGTLSLQKENAPRISPRLFQANDHRHWIFSCLYFSIHGIHAPLLIQSFSSLCAHLLEAFPELSEVLKLCVQDLQTVRLGGRLRQEAKPQNIRETEITREPNSSIMASGCGQLEYSSLKFTHGKCVLMWNTIVGRYGSTPFQTFQYKVSKGRQQPS